MLNSTYRTELLIGKNALDILKNSHVAVFGIGGVGSFAVEALVRTGIGNVTVVDKDTVDITNINRQIHANFNSIGKDKTSLIRERALEINPNLNINCYQTFFNENSYPEFFESKLKYDYVIDAIDTIKSKLFLIQSAQNKGIPIISSMGMGNKLNPRKIEVSDIYKTSVCPLARIVRKYARRNRIKKLKVVYSKEEPIKIKNNTQEKLVGSMMFVPSCAGITMAYEVVRSILSDRND